MSKKSWIEWVRTVGKVEGLSYLLLLGIAMPLKYMAGMPMAVSIVGLIHGVLFVAFVGVLFVAWLKTPLTMKWAIYAFIASLLPFGPFVIDKHLQQFEAN